jgi:serine/threonine-protein kinase/endoribonuclease IRE1
VSSELLEIVLVASVDGKFHALNRTTGHTLWSMSSFSSSSSMTVSPPSSLAPLVRTRHIDQDPDLTDDCLDACQEMYIIEPQSGDIYVAATPSSPLRRFPFSMPALVAMWPFSFATADDHRVFVGRKATAEVVVELEMGAVRFGGPDTCPWGPFPDLDARDGRAPPPRRREVVVGRTGVCVPGDTSFRKLNHYT